MRMWIAALQERHNVPVCAPVYNIVTRTVVHMPSLAAVSHLPEGRSLKGSKRIYPITDGHLLGVEGPDSCPGLL